MKWDKKYHTVGPISNWNIKILKIDTPSSTVAICQLLHKWATPLKNSKLTNTEMSPINIYPYSQKPNYNGTKKLYDDNEHIDGYIIQM